MSKLKKKEVNIEVKRKNKQVIKKRSCRLLCTFKRKRRENLESIGKITEDIN